MHEKFVSEAIKPVVTTSGSTMKIYFDRQPRRGKRGDRWWLFSISNKPVED